MTLVTLPQVKAQLNLGTDVNDTALTAYINAVDAVVERHTGDLVTEQTLTADLDLDGWTSRLILPSRPLTAVSSIAATDGSTTYDTTGVISRASGVVILPYRVCGSVTVEYTAGYDVAPAHYQQAALIIVQHLWKTRRGPSARPSTSDLPDTLAPREIGYAIPNAALELLGPRAPVVA